MQNNTWEQNKLNSFLTEQYLWHPWASACESQGRAHDRSASIRHPQYLGSGQATPMHQVGRCCQGYCSPVTTTKQKHFLRKRKYVASHRGTFGTDVTAEYVEVSRMVLMHQRCLQVPFQWDWRALQNELLDHGRLPFLLTERDQSSIETHHQGSRYLRYKAESQFWY